MITYDDFVVFLQNSGIMERNSIRHIYLYLLEAVAIADNHFPTTENDVANIAVSYLIRGENIPVDVAAVDADFVHITATGVRLVKEHLAEQDLSE